jgi:hypothetical protein
MNSEKAEIEQAQAIGRAAAAQGLKPEDVSFMSKQPKVAKQPKSKPKPSEASEAKPSEPQPIPNAPSDTDLLNKKTGYDEARSKWARGELSPQELETFYASYMRARATYSSQQSLYGHHVPPANPLPGYERDLDVAKLDRDDLTTKLREAKQEEQKLKQEKASPPVRIAAVAVEALKILQDPGDARSIPAIAGKALKAEERVKTLETQLRVARREN